MIHLAHRLTPPIAFDAVLSLLGKARHRGKPLHRFGAVYTHADAKPLHDGRFAEIYERWHGIDPNVRYNQTRYRLYNVCMLAHLCGGISGDFVSAGVSFGVAQRMVFDFVDLRMHGKRLHLIDPFDASGDGATKRRDYNTDIDLVRRQYPAEAPVVFHRALIPDALPLPGVGRISFVFNNTGNAFAEAAALPLLYEALSPGGCIISDQYAYGFDAYQPALKSLGIVPLWLPSGQGVFFKH